MRHVEVHAIATGRTAVEIFPILCDFDLYQKHSDAVRNVTIVKAMDGRSVSKWEVNFRQGILRWTEEDHFDHEALSIRFQQTEGDAEHFSGQWLLSDTEKGCVVRFMADFDMGIPSLSEIIDPIAEQALQENIQSILKGVLRGQIEFVNTDSIS